MTEEPLLVPDRAGVQVCLAWMLGGVKVGEVVVPQAMLYQGVDAEGRVLTLGQQLDLAIAEAMRQALGSVIDTG